MSETIKIPARLDLSAVQNFVTDLSSQDFSKDVTLDATDVNHLGALGAQAIIAAARASSTAGGQFSITNVSEQVEAQLVVMGMSAETLQGGLQ